MTAHTDSNVKRPYITIKGSIEFPDRRRHTFTSYHDTECDETDLNAEVKIPHENARANKADQITNTKDHGLNTDPKDPNSKTQHGEPHEVFKLIKALLKLSNKATHHNILETLNSENYEEAQDITIKLQTKSNDGTRPHYIIDFQIGKGEKEESDWVELAVKSPSLEEPEVFLEKLAFLRTDENIKAAVERMKEAEEEEPTREHQDESAEAASKRREETVKEKLVCLEGEKTIDKGLTVMEGAVQAFLYPGDEKADEPSTSGVSST